MSDHLYEGYYIVRIFQSAVYERSRFIQLQSTAGDHIPIGLEKKVDFFTVVRSK